MFMVLYGGEHIPHDAFGHILRRKLYHGGVTEKSISQKRLRVQPPNTHRQGLHLCRGMMFCPFRGHAWNPSFIRK